MQMTFKCARLAIPGLIAACLAFSSSAFSQETVHRDVEEPIEVREVADGLYFVYDHSSSNSSFLVTEEGVLVVDSRQHRRDGEDLIERIREITDKPIKWLINTHLHADHYLGNPAFKEAGATIVAHHVTAELMERMHEKEISRRGGFFERRGYDADDTPLVMPDLTFHQEMSIKLGDDEVRLLYLGAGQNPGDTFVHFPSKRSIHAPGAFARQSWANTVFTPSVEEWIGVLEEVAAMDIDVVMPAHGDVATLDDVREFSEFLDEQYHAVKAAVEQGMSVDQIVEALPFEKYAEWRNYSRREHSIRSLHELITTGEAGYFK